MVEVKNKEIIKETQTEDQENRNKSKVLRRKKEKRLTALLLFCCFLSLMVSFCHFLCECFLFSSPFIFYVQSVLKVMFQCLCSNRLTGVKKNPQHDKRFWDLSCRQRMVRALLTIHKEVLLCCSFVFILLKTKETVKGLFVLLKYLYLL